MLWFIELNMNKYFQVSVLNYLLITVLKDEIRVHTVMLVTTNLYHYSTAVVELLLSIVN